MKAAMTVLWFFPKLALRMLGQLCIMLVLLFGLAKLPLEWQTQVLWHLRDPSSALANDWSEVTTWCTHWFEGGQAKAVVVPTQPPAPVRAETHSNAGPLPRFLFQRGFDLGRVLDDLSTKSPSGGAR